MLFAIVDYFRASVLRQLVGVVIRPATRGDTFRHPRGNRSSVAFAPRDLLNRNKSSCLIVPTPRLRQFQSYFSEKIYPLKVSAYRISRVITKGDLLIILLPVADLR
jgi:hypothetical protein